MTEYCSDSVSLKLKDSDTGNMIFLNYIWILEKTVCEGI